jgi:hypothetical protein
VRNRRALLVTVVWIIACSDEPPDSSPRWVRVARDANYTVYLDTGRIRPYGERELKERAWEVWYRTDHAQPRVHGNDGEQFNREVVQSVVRCNSLMFRVARVDMSMGSAKPIVQQRLTTEEFRRQQWRRVVPGTTEEIAGRAACHYGTQMAMRR